MTQPKEFRCPVCGHEMDRYDFPDQTERRGFCNWFAFVQARHQHLLLCAETALEAIKKVEEITLYAHNKKDGGKLLLQIREVAYGITQNQRGQ